MTENASSTHDSKHFYRINERCRGAVPAPLQPITNGHIGGAQQAIAAKNRELFVKYGLQWAADHVFNADELVRTATEPRTHAYAGVAAPPIACSFNNLDRVEGLCWDLEAQCCDLAAFQLLHRLIILPPHIRMRASPPLATAPDRAAWAPISSAGFCHPPGCPAPYAHASAAPGPTDPAQDRSLSSSTDPQDLEPTLERSPAFNPFATPPFLAELQAVLEREDGA